MKIKINLKDANLLNALLDMTDAEVAADLQPRWDDGELYIPDGAVKDRAVKILDQSNWKSSKRPEKPKRGKDRSEVSSPFLDLLDKIEALEARIAQLEGNGKN